MDREGTVRLAVEDGRAALTLDAPARKNAISARMWEELIEHSAAIAQRDGVRVVSIRGAGSLFSAGADITGFDAARSGAGSSYDDLVEAACSAIEALPMPTVASVRGVCIGAAVSLAASCDLRIATEDSHFTFPAARLGLGYDPRGVDRLVRVFGAGLTRRLLLTAERVPAARVHALGGLDALASADALEAETAALVERIAMNAPLTLAAVKVAVRASLAPDDDGLRERALGARARADASEDYAEGRRAFAEKRPPMFKGR
ncbi:MAG: enoyl-CoA hydratase-related protein [Parvibaculaceae bacterium]